MKIYEKADDDSYQSTGYVGDGRTKQLVPYIVQLSAARQGSSVPKSTDGGGPGRISRLPINGLAFVLTNVKKTLSKVMLEL
jgi:hypothetical protein